MDRQPCLDRRAAQLEAGVGDQRRVQCGASLISSDTRALDAWQQMLSNAPQGVASSTAARSTRPAAAKVAPDRLFGRMAQMVADVPLVGGLALLATGTGWTCVRRLRRIARGLAR